MNKILELRRKRADLISKARAIKDRADKDETRAADARCMTPDEQRQFDGFMDESDTVLKEIEKLQGEQRTVDRLAEAERTLEARDGARGGGGERHDEQQTQPGAPVRFKFERRTSPNSTRELLLEGARGSAAYRTMFNYQLRNVLAGQGNERPMNAEEKKAEVEFRSMQMDIATAGGFLVPPLQFVADLIAQVDDLVYIRQWATVMTLTNAVSLGVPTRDTDVDDADWTAELLTGSETPGPTVGRRDLTPHPMAKLAKLSNKLIRAAAIDPEALIRSRLAYKFALTQEKAFLLGTGSQQPLGLFTASAYGISTGRDVVTGSATNFTADGLINIKYKLKPQYWGKARWLFHRDGMKLIRQIKDGNNNYVWNAAGLPGMAMIGNAPDNLLGLPAYMSEYVPNTFTTALYVGMLGDFSNYWIVDALDMQLQRLVELYAATNQTGIIGRMECDGMPVLEEAFVRIKTS